MKYILLFLIMFSFSLESYSQGSQEWKQYYQQASGLARQRKFDQALEMANKAHDEVVRIYGENSTFQATQLGLLGRINYMSGNYNEAIQKFNHQKRILTEKNKSTGREYASCLNNLGTCYRAVGELDQVEPLLKESIKLKKEISGGTDSSYAKSLANLGQYYVSLGRYPEAEKILKESLEIKLELFGEDNYSTGMTYYSVGLLYQAIGNFDQAFINLEKGAQILEKTSSMADPNTANAHFEIANLYIQRGDQKKGEEYLKKTSSIKKQLMKNINLESANSLYNMAKADIRLKKYDSAKEILNGIIPGIKSKLGQGHPLYRQTINSLGIILWITGELEEAYNYLSESVLIADAIFGTDNIKYADAVLILAGLLKQMEEYDEADMRYFEGFDIYLNLIENYFPYYSEAEKTKFYQSIKEQFDKFNSYVLQRYLDNPLVIKKMYDFHIATKGILLDYSKNLQSIIENSQDPELIKKYDLWKSKKEQLARLYNESPGKLESINIDIDSLEKFANNLEKNLSEKSQIFTSKVKIEIPKWEDVQKTLKVDEAIVEVIRFKFFANGWQDSTYYAILVTTQETKEVPELIVLQNGVELDGTYLSRHKKTIKSKFPDKRSYPVYWAEIDKLIEGKKTVYLSADGVYNIINPASLLKPDKSYVVDHIKIININNAKELLEENAAIEITQSATLFGFPKYKVDENVTISEEDLDAVSENEIKIAPLPGTKKEIDKITSLLAGSGWQTKTFLDVNASEGNFKSVKNTGIIHIATHGYFLSDLGNVDDDRVFGVDREKAVQNPLLRAGLIFSGASNFLNYDFTSHEDDENGILTAYEVKNMDLRGTDLVIMSACETGLGKIMNGEGVYGLQRAFQVAGVNAIIMSLWTVDDQTTQELMTAFYQNYLGGMEITEAFNNAVLTIKTKYKQPYYWGAFKLLGY